MHTRLILPGEIIDVLSEDKKSPDSTKLAGCKNITYIAQNTTKHGIIFWDQPEQNSHTLQAFIADSNSNATYFHKIEYLTNDTQASLAFNQLHDYLRKDLGQVHHVRAKIVRDHSLDKPNISGTPAHEEACTIITQTSDKQNTRITRYMRELQHNKQFLVAVTAIPVSWVNRTSYQVSSTNPLEGVQVRLIDASKSQAATYTNDIAKNYFYLNN